MQQPIEIEPALKGTTFGTALEGALRDEQLKRAARAAEIANPKVIPQARQLAQELRQHVAGSPAPKPARPAAAPLTGPDQEAKRADWVRMAQAADTAPESLDLNPDEEFNMTATTTEHDLSPTQIKILAAGVEASPFKPGSVGRAIGVMLDLKLIAPTERKGWWTLTEAGKDAYEIHLAQEAAANDQVFKATEGAINLDDPALKTGDPSAEDGALAVIRSWMTDDNSDRQTVIGYVEGLRRGLANETAIVDAINALAAADSKGDMDPRDYVAELRAILQNVVAGGTPHTLGVYQGIIDAIQTMLEADGSQLTLVNYVVDLRQKAGLLDDYATRIESLNRCIAAQQETINARMVGATGRADVMLAVQILDELCDLIPEVEQYRVAREAAVKAISNLKARRS